MKTKYIHEFKIGDIVHKHGGVFRIVENARESLFHRPQSAHLTTADGPSDTARAKAICIKGTIPGYFKPGAEWTFQGNFLAGKYIVE